MVRLLTIIQRFECGQTTNIIQRFECGQTTNIIQRFECGQTTNYDTENGGKHKLFDVGTITGRLVVMIDDSGNTVTVFAVPTIVLFLLVTQHVCHVA